jgi:uncharacterized protein (DUF302 family)
MTTKQISVQRVSVISSRPFDHVMTTFEDAVGHPDLREFVRATGQAKTVAEMKEIVENVIGESGFMEFARYDLGAYLQKEQGPATPRSVRLVIGNPLIMKEMLKHVPDAGSYAPVTILLDERPDGVHLSYDKMASFLGSYGSPEALKVAQDLDAKVEKLLAKAAA